jgi:rhodanese-related sulfurtransferase
MVRTISVEEAARRWREDGGFELIDVRTPMEYREVHAEPARSVPLDALSPAAILSGREAPHGTPVYLICRSGSRSRQAAEAFEREGFANAVSVDGGTLAWERAGLPVVRGARKAISLERQVRIAAGSLVVLGTALGAFVHPGFLGLAAFVGAGLVFAGITDTCGMGMMLARMPWNRVTPQSAACSTEEARS